MRLALFDLDGTITTKNVFIEFIKHAVGRRRFVAGLCRLGPYVLLHYVHLISRKRIKEIFIRYFFAGMTESELRHLALEFNRAHLPGLIRPGALERIRWHHDVGDVVVVVSACVDMWIEDWCRLNRIKLIATGIEVRDGRVTGKLATENCYGAEKMRRIHGCFNRSHLSHVFAYGDSRGDKEMLAFADEKFFRPFRGSSTVVSP